MSISIVQDSESRGSFSSSATISTSATSAGNLLVVGVNMQGHVLSATVSSVVDNAGNTYVHVPSSQATSNNGGTLVLTDLWYKANSISGATLVTVTFTNASAGLIDCYFTEVSGIATSSSLDVVNVINNGICPGSTTPGPTLTISQPVEFLIEFAAVAATDGNLHNVQSPWINNSGNTLNNSEGYLITSTTGSYSATFLNTGGGSAYCASSAAFFPPLPPLLLTLTDSVTSSDTLGVTRAENVSDSMTVTDSFSLLSSAIVTTPIPKVETLTNAVIPAEVKTFYHFE